VKSRSDQQGFALVTAVFLLVVLAVLGVAATRIGNGQQAMTDLRILQSRAAHAADAGLEWGIVRIGASGCPVVNPTPLAFNQDLAGIAVSVRCQSFGSGQYLITSTASSGSYGKPSFVQRTKVARIP
jgi:MSHA biogenesis protein MshP